jgi:alkanesulfonate monooxygenase SsuD/methylene tetrahydromethanopterin reductase-like flavin-dependent oxidoreductase (luciferase family)
MKLGIVLANSAVVAGTATTEDLLAMAEAADATPGWEHVWVGDSLLSVPRLESTVLLAACAARTRRVRLGVGCLASMGLREPLTLALQWASLDVVSNGRMTLVACTGPGGGPGIEDELAAFGLTHRGKVARMEEWVSLLRELSRGGAVSFEGEHVRVSDFALEPGFVQRPLPIWLVANPSRAAGAKTLERVLGRVARLGDGWMTFGSAPELLPPRLELIHAQREALGRQHDPDFPVCVYVDVNIAPDPRRAFADAVATGRREGRRHVTEDALRGTAAIGSAEQCLEFLGKLVEAGANSFALRPLSQRPRAQLELLSEHLLPHLEARARVNGAQPMRMAGPAAPSATTR